MADKKISDLTSKASPELTDYLVIVDNTASPIETKKCTIAQMLLALGLKQGATDNNSVTTAGWSPVFPFTLGTDPNGGDYNLIITCVDQKDATEAIGYEIKSRSDTGFTIIPVKDAWIEYTALLK